MAVYEDVHTSLLKFCGDFISDKSLDNFENFDFDSHGSINELPDKNLIGIAEYSITEDQGLYYITCAVVVCTLSDDSQLKIMRPVIDELFKKLKVGFEGIKIVDSNSAKLLGNMKIMDMVEVLPVARQNDSRPVTLINVHLGCTFLSPV